MKTVQFHFPRTSKIVILLLAALFIIPSFLFAASVSVDELLIIADGNYNINTNKFEMNTYFKMTTSFEGGYKFAAKANFEANVQNLATSFYDTSTDFYNKAFMIFKGAEVSARNLANSHLFLTFWTGTYKYLGSGNKYHGYLYYPESDDVDYKGFYRLRGTGISTELKFWEEQFRAKFHLYQNTNFVHSDDPLAFYYFSFDTEIGLYFKQVYVELFGGLTFPIKRDDTSLDAHIPYGRYKAGFTFWVGNDNIDFLSTFGVPDLDHRTGSSNFFNSIFLLAEIHFAISYIDNTISFLTRPMHFNERKFGENHAGEDTDIDVNYQFKVIVPDFPLSGGFAFNFQFSKNNPNDMFKAILSPFLTITMSGMIWNIGMHYDFSRIYIASQVGNDYRFYISGLKMVISVSSKF